MSNFHDLPDAGISVREFSVKFEHGPNKGFVPQLRRMDIKPTDQADQVIIFIPHFCEARITIENGTVTGSVAIMHPHTRIPRLWEARGLIEFGDANSFRGTINLEPIVADGFSYSIEFNGQK